MRIVLAGSSGGIGKSILNKIKEDNDIIEINSCNIDFRKNFSFETECEALIYCSGVNKVCSYQEITEEIINDTMNVNTISFIRLCKQLKFKKKSNIIAIGSLYSTSSKTGRLAYSMSKHALYAAIKTLAVEMSQEQIKVNMISPGFVDTSMTRKNNSKERIEFLENNIPLGITSADEISNMCNYLLKNNNSITGQNIIIDGGYSLMGV
jgi:3-oxoacyl-[acyl-carrier protein] reductase